MLYSTRYGQGIANIVQAYQPGPMMVAAIEALVSTIQQHAVAAYRDNVAQSVCEGIHPGPPTGLKCLACYEAEQQYGMQQIVQGEIEAFAATRERSEENIERMIRAEESAFDSQSIAEDVFEVEPIEEG